MTKQTVQQLLERDVLLDEQRSQVLSADQAVPSDFRQQVAEFVRTVEEKAGSLKGEANRKRLADISQKWRLVVGMAGQESHQGKEVSWVDDDLFFGLWVDGREVPAVRLGEGRYYTPMLPYAIFPTASALAKTYAESEGRDWIGPAQGQ